MKLFMRAFIIALFVIIPCFLPGKPAERILVLGFDSRLLNDIQDRLVRETVMRSFHDKGYRIVPVMEVESLFHGSRIRQIRKLNRDTVMSICDKLDAGYACYGSLVPALGGRDDRIRQGKSYICTITLFRRDANSFDELKLQTEGAEDLHRYFTSLAEAIVVAVIKLFELGKF
ncbi:MAG: hypothetical protein A2W19_06080 [Spirochaetes bacterium RBG_16_49_21]|nr:MAG: hypothetical protein A2W19_06080 [Spirochaetes bacterium RBG_16_49_21]